MNISFITFCFFAPQFNGSLDRNCNLKPHSSGAAVASFQTAPAPSRTRSPAAPIMAGGVGDGPAPLPVTTAAAAAADSDSANNYTNYLRAAASSPGGHVPPGDLPRQIIQNVPAPVPVPVPVPVARTDNAGPGGRAPRRHSDAPNGAIVRAPGRARGVTRNFRAAASVGASSPPGHPPGRGPGRPGAGRGGRGRQPTHRARG